MDHVLLHSVSSSTSTKASVRNIRRKGIELSRSQSQYKMLASPPPLPTIAAAPPLEDWEVMYPLLTMASSLEQPDDDEFTPTSPPIYFPTADDPQCATHSPTGIPICYHSTSWTSTAGRSYLSTPDYLQNRTLEMSIVVASNDADPKEDHTQCIREGSPPYTPADDTVLVGGHWAAMDHPCHSSTSLGRCKRSRTGRQGARNHNFKRARVEEGQTEERGTRRARVE